MASKFLLSDIILQMTNKKILIIEDESSIRETIVYNLKKEGYSVLTASDGDTGLWICRRKNPDLVILDLMIPKIPGEKVCSILREEKNFVPILILSAKDRTTDKITGLEIGADDYLTKPFSLEELIARIKALLRRSEDFISKEQPKQSLPALKLNNLIINFEGCEIIKNKQKINISRKELELLKILIKNSNKVLTREILISKVWGDDFYGDDKTLDVHIRWLREKIEDNPGKPQYIRTIRGIGYKFILGKN